MLCQLSGVTRGSHLYVLCRSICEWDQKGIKLSKPFWGADQGTYKLPKSTNGCNWPLILGNQAINASTFFLPIQKLDHSCRHFYRRHKWLPLVLCWSYLDASPKHVSIPHEVVATIISQWLRGNSTSHAQQRAQEVELKRTHIDGGFLCAVWAPALQPPQKSFLL